MHRLQRYAALYAGVLANENRMCLCGMLAADANILPKPMRDNLRAFFDRNELWLAQLLEQGREDGELDFYGSAPDESRYLVSALEGAMLVARPYGQVERFEAIAQRLITGLAPRAAAGSGVG